MKPSAGLACGLALVLLVSACGSVEPAESDTTVPNAVSVADGAELYAANCAACHGADLRGTDDGPSHLSIVYEPNHHADISFQLAIQQGVRSHHWPFGDMEPIEDLDLDEIAAIVAFVREVQMEQGFEPYPP